MLGSSDTITRDDLPGRIANTKPIPTATDLSYRNGVSEARKELILTALARTNGNRAAAAKILGLEAKYLLKLMKSLGIE